MLKTVVGQHIWEGMSQKKVLPILEELLVKLDLGLAGETSKIDRLGLVRNWHCLGCIIALSKMNLETQVGRTSDPFLKARAVRLVVECRLWLEELVRKIELYSNQKFSIVVPFLTKENEDVVRSNTQQFFRQI